MKITILKCKYSQGWFIYQQLPDITLLINVHDIVLDSAFLQSCVSYLQYICYFVFYYHCSFLYFKLTMCVSTKITMCKYELLCKCVTLILINMHLFIFYILSYLILIYYLIIYYLINENPVEVILYITI